ncbi:xylulokinase [Myxococcota bacterium]|nr:xylulokinase [Myxococcota bacterium]
MSALFAGFDVGTQSTKGVVLDAERGAIVARASVSYGLVEGLGPHDAEQDPATWIDALRSVAARLFTEVDPARVEGVGVSGQQHGLVVLDADDRVVRPAKLWCDTSTADEASELSRTLGRTIPTGFTAPKILWMRRCEPERWARVASVLLPHDYVNLRLTGVKTMEAGDASGTGFFDPVTRAFDPRAMAAIDPALASKLPPLVAAGQPAGRLSREGAALLGLAEGALVASGGGDNMMSAIGSGATRPGVSVVSLGTSGTVFAYSARPIVDPAGDVAAFCDSTGAWLPLLCVMNMTGVANEVALAFDGLDHAALTALASRVAPGADGLVLAPYLTGERVPNLPNATGALAGLRPGLLRPGHLYRAALEGTAASLALGVARMRALGLDVERVRLTGGGSKNPLWARIIADVLEVPVVRLAEPESAALGAAIQAAWTVRRAAGDPVELDALAATFVSLDGPEISPEPGCFPIYRALRAQLATLTARLFS